MRGAATAGHKEQHEYAPYPPRQMREVPAARAARPRLVLDSASGWCARRAVRCNQCPGMRTHSDAKRAIPSGLREGPGRVSCESSPRSEGILPLRKPAAFAFAYKDRVGGFRDVDAIWTYRDDQSACGGGGVPAKWEEAGRGHAARCRRGAEAELTGGEVGGGTAKEKAHEKEGEGEVKSLGAAVALSPPRRRYAEPTPHSSSSGGTSSSSSSLPSGAGGRARACGDTARLTHTAAESGSARCVWGVMGGSGARVQAGEGRCAGPHRVRRGERAGWCTRSALRVAPTSTYTPARGVEPFGVHRPRAASHGQRAGKMKVKARAKTLCRTYNPSSPSTTEPKPMPPLPPTARTAPSRRRSPRRPGEDGRGGATASRSAAAAQGLTASGWRSDIPNQCAYAQRAGCRCGLPVTVTKGSKFLGQVTMVSAPYYAEARAESTGSRNGLILTTYMAPSARSNLCPAYVRETFPAVLFNPKSRLPSKWDTWDALSPKPVAAACGRVVSEHRARARKVEGRRWSRKVRSPRHFKRHGETSQNKRVRKKRKFIVTYRPMKTCVKLANNQSTATFPRIKLGGCIYLGDAQEEFPHRATAESFLMYIQ
ncbi:hypothetical protein DFH07DRAFT_779673 [Mycena maculata]|uniref:Uncharacterized protein n=1 Tax=Mycena maculata TaxID=230809 RepID=A0AAD7I8U3_9AGAR|nr:hypothetical protein DFH07DRAFT_779673 [Mycena maculata]